MSAPPLPMGVAKLLGANEGKIRRHSADDPDGVVLATVEHHNELELAAVLFLKIRSIFAQNRLDAALFVVSRDKEQQAGLGNGAHFILSSF